MSELERFVDIVRRLRDPEHGCSWDCAQTLSTLRRFLVEESGEYLEAVENGDVAAMRDELGDLLLQVVLNAQVAADEGLFNLEDVARGAGDKMVRRHPHVFGEQAGRQLTEAELRSEWERIKNEERAAKAERSISPVGDIPRSLPGMLRLQKALHRASVAGFSLAGDSREALGLVREAMNNVEMSLDAEASTQEQTLGELLLAVAELCRQVKVQGEEVAQAAMSRFVEHFAALEQRMASGEEKQAAWRDIITNEETKRGEK